jgi:D-arginine dehydrogenase
MRRNSADFIVVGAGIAGASAAYELAAHGRVIVLEAESQPGYHTTGRSAALYSETYGNAVMRALTTASKAFYLRPPAGFAQHPLLTPRGALLVARADQLAALDHTMSAASALVSNLQRLTGDQVRARVPVFSGDQVAAAMLEPDAMDIDVHALHQGYLRGLMQRGSQVVCNAQVRALARDGAEWRAQTAAGEFAAPVVINAAGAWADVVGALAGAARIGLTPKRRTAITFDAPAGLDLHASPAVCDVDEQWYFKPEAGRLLASPADETPSAPCDAQPEELDVAVLVDRITTRTLLTVAKIRSKWAGLRSFVADKTVVAGFDAHAPGFFWLAGQGGYGIQTAPALGRVAGALARGEKMPAEMQALGLAAGDLAPTRSTISGALTPR